jgi:hypothetical protein
MTNNISELDSYVNFFTTFAFNQNHNSCQCAYYFCLLNATIFLTSSQKDPFCTHQQQKSITVDGLINEQAWIT